jgi:hypothetical protein
MADSEKQKYQQLALFSIIVAEVVVTPSLLGGLAFFLLKGQSSQTWATALAAFLGLGIGFYRIFRLIRRQQGKT